MQVVLDEAMASYPPEIVVELTSENRADLEANVTRIVDWINLWLRDRGLGENGSREAGGPEMADLSSAPNPL
jgi:hypothetical protein